MKRVEGPDTEDEVAIATRPAAEAHICEGPTLIFTHIVSFLLDLVKISEPVTY